MQQPSTIVKILIAGAIFAAGGGAAIFGFRSLWIQNHRLSTFEPVNATVKEVGVELTGGGSGKRPLYKIDVTYEYTYEKATFISNTLQPTEWGCTFKRKSAEDITARFAEGNVVTAYCNPDAPEEAFLIRDHLPTATNYAFGIGGSLLALIGGFGLIRMIWR